jgi:hypothetical protein
VQHSLAANRLVLNLQHVLQLSSAVIARQELETDLQHWHVHSCSYKMACISWQRCSTTDEQPHAATNSSLQNADHVADHAAGLGI